jgi:hypothetical protein
MEENEREEDWLFKATGGYYIRPEAIQRLSWGIQGRRNMNTTVAFFNCLYVHSAADENRELLFPIKSFKDSNKWMNYEVLVLLMKKFVEKGWLKVVRSGQKHIGATIVKATPLFLEWFDSIPEKEREIYKPEISPNPRGHSWTNPQRVKMVKVNGRMKEKPERESFSPKSINKLPDAVERRKAAKKIKERGKDVRLGIRKCDYLLALKNLPTPAILRNLVDNDWLLEGKGGIYSEVQRTMRIYALLDKMKDEDFVVLNPDGLTDYCFSFKGLEAIRGNRTTFVDKTAEGGRLSSGFTSLKKCVRDRLWIEWQGNWEKLTQIDAEACQLRIACFLAGVQFPVGGWQSFKTPKNVMKKVVLYGVGSDSSPSWRGFSNSELSKGVSQAEWELAYSELRVLCVDKVLFCDRSGELQKLESNWLVEVLNNEDVLFVLPVHDALFVPSTEVERVLKAAKEAWEKRFPCENVFVVKNEDETPSETRQNRPKTPLKEESAPTPQEQNETPFTASEAVLEAYKKMPCLAQPDKSVTEMLREIQEKWG